jgi:predicted RND superfamily exporter protein
MKKWLEFTLLFCLRHKLALFIIILLITSASIIQIIKFQTDKDFDIWFNSKDSSFVNYKDFVKTFGNDQYFIVVYRNDSLFSRKEILQNRQITKKFKELNGVAEVLSLTSLRVPAVTPIGHTMRSMIPKDSLGHPEIKDKILNERILLDNLLSKDGNATVYHIYQSDQCNKDELYDQIQKIVLNTPHPEYFSFPSGIILALEGSKLAKEESVKFIILGIIIITIVLLLIYRNLILGIIPVLVALISLIWTLAIYALCGGKINMLSGIMPLVILVMSLSFAVHLLTRIKQNYKDEATRFEVLNKTYQSVMSPAFFAFLTTYLAILTFAISKIQPIQMFGIFSSTGILISFILSFILVLIITDLSWRKIYIERSKNFITELRVKRYLNFILVKNSKLILFIIILISFLSLYGVSRLNVEADVYGFFKRSHKINVAKENVDKWFDSVLPFEVVFRLKDSTDEGMDKFVTVLGTLEKELLKEPEIKNCYSAATLLNSFGLQKYHVPIKRLVADSSNSFLKKYYSLNERAIRLTVKTKWMNNAEMMQVVKRIDSNINALFSQKDVTYYITGAALLYSNLNTELVNNLIKSISLSFLAIFVILIFIFKKPFLIITSTIPNVLPVLNTLALMGFLNIKIDVGTVLIASVSLGIAVDDTIYFMTNYLKLKKESGKYSAIETTFNSVSNSLIRTSAILFIGFILMSFSTYPPIIYLGIFVSLNIALALVYDLVMVPLLLYRFDK